jgi:hypothetical protein
VGIVRGERAKGQRILQVAPEIEVIRLNMLKGATNSLGYGLTGLFVRIGNLSDSTTETIGGGKFFCKCIPFLFELLGTFEIVTFLGFFQFCSE